MLDDADPGNGPEAPRTLLDVKRKVAKHGLSKAYTAELAAAIDALVTHKQLDGDFGVDDALDRISIDPAILLPMLRIPFGVSLGNPKSAWRKIRFRVKKALHLTGAYATIDSRHIDLAPAWRRLKALLPPKSRVRLIACWGSLHDVRPEDVSDLHLPALEAWLSTWMTLRSMRRQFLGAVREWNEAATSVPDWPKNRLNIGKRRIDHFNLMHDAWPAELHAEIERIYTGWLDGNPGPLNAVTRPYSKVTADRNKMRLYRLMAAYSKMKGARPEDVRSIAPIVTPVVARGLLDFIADWLKVAKPGGGASELRAVMTLIMKIARESFGPYVSASDMAELQSLADVIRKPGSHQGRRKYPPLQMFDDADLFRRFLVLPKQIYDRVLGGGKINSFQRNQLMCSLNMALNIDAPLCPIQQSMLVIGETVHRTQDSGQEVLRIQAPGDGVETCFELSGEIVEFYDLYLQHGYGATEGDRLFLYRDRTSKPKPHNKLIRQMVRFIEKELGVYMTGSQFLLVSGFVYLKKHRDDFEPVRKLLGHEDIMTTKIFYAAMELRTGSKAVSVFLEAKCNNTTPRVLQPPL